MKTFAGVLAGVLLLAGSAHAMQLTSPDIKDGSVIASAHIYTRCGGRNLSPALSWSGAPRDTKSIAITVIDKSVAPAGWTHWIVIGLPPGTNSLARGATLPTGAKAVQSDFGDASYDGPCPPPGSGVHRYEFTVWALKSAAPAIKEGETANDIAGALSAEALASSTITGLYQR